MAKKQILTLKRLAEISNGGEKAAFEFANSILSEIPELIPRPEPIDIHAYEMLSQNNHFEASVDIPEVSEEISKLIKESVESL